MADRRALRCALAGLLPVLLVALSACGGSADARPTSSALGSTETTASAPLHETSRPPEDGSHIYQHEPACATDVDALSLRQCAKLNHQCTEAPGGRLVQWYRAPGERPNAWKRHELGCLYDDSQKASR
jgi:hypothetical protein